MFLISFMTAFFSFPLLFLENSWFMGQVMSLQFNLNILMFVLTVIWVTLTVLFFSQFYMSHYDELLVFLVWTLLFVLSMIILLISKSWWIMLIGWEGLGLTSFWLVAFYSSWVAHNGSILTFMTNRVGDMCLIFSGMYWAFFYVNFLSLSGLLLLLMGILTKSSQYPFMSWLPAAMNAPTPISALVHSSTLVTAGLYLALKFKWTDLSTMSLILASTMGIFTLLVGSWAALKEGDLKKIVAFSTMSQLGLLLWFFSSGSLILVLFHLVSHAFFKSSLFVGVGTMIFHGFGNQSKNILSSNQLNLVSQVSWLYLTLLNLSSLPFLVGFYSKEAGAFNLLKNQTYSMIFVFWLALSLTLAYAFRLFKSISLKGNNFSSNLSLKMILVSSGLMLFPLLFLGFIWNLNLIYPSLGALNWGVALMILLFAALLYQCFTIFFYITFFLKLNLSAMKSVFLNLDSIFHLSKIYSGGITMLNWKVWSLMLVLLFFSML